MQEREQWANKTEKNPDIPITKKTEDFEKKERVSFSK